MNIIKFKDVIIEGDEYFNEALKGKYAYVVNWLYIFPFDVLGENTQEMNQSYIGLESGSIPISTYEGYYAELAEYAAYVDEQSTEDANSIDKYIYLNDYATDDDITIDELKRFRTWLAEQLLAADGLIEQFCKDFPAYDASMVTSMLLYYANEMSDPATRGLSMFIGNVPALIDSPSKSHCGCSQIQPITVTVSSKCDPLEIYTQSIYHYMVDVFSNVGFWNENMIKDTVVVDFKHYIDNIIKNDFPLYSTEPQLFADCSCLNVNADEQKRLQQILSRLSQSLEYIIEGSVEFHRNFIYAALNDWARYLYETMRW